MLREAAITAALISIWHVPAAAADVIATEVAPSQISSARGMAVWSTYDRPAQRYRLRLFANGVVRTLNVASQPRGFDVDLGIDRRGHTVAVYSRCPGTVAVGPGRSVYEKGCRLYELRLSTGVERPLRTRGPSGWSQMFPSLDGDNLAFARIEPNGDDPITHLFAYNLRSKRLRELRTGPRGAFIEGAAQPTRIDVRGRRVVLGWEYLDDACNPNSANDTDERDQIWLLTLRGASRLLADAGSCPRASFSSPVLTPRSVLYLARSGGSADLRLTRFNLTVQRFDQAPGYDGTESIAGDEGLAFSIHRDGVDTWQVVRSTPRFAAAG